MKNSFSYYPQKGKIFFIAVLVIIFTLAGCGNQGGSQTTNALSNVTEATTQMATTTGNGASGGNDSTIASVNSGGTESATTTVTTINTAGGNKTTLSVSVFERGNTTNTYGTATDNFWTRWIQSEFGDPNDINLEYIPIPRAEESAKLNTLMASGTAPDIIFSYDTRMILNYGRDGGLAILNDLLEIHGKNILANIAPALPYGTLDGMQYAIPAVRSRVGRYTNFMRKDWLDQLGYDLPINSDGFYHISVEDFEALLYEAKNMDFDNTGMEMFPMGMAGAYDATQCKPIIFSFVNRMELTDEIAATTPQMLWPGFKEGVRFLNKLYNDKLIDPDFMVDTDTALPSFNAQVSTGRTFAFGQDDFYKGGIIALYEEKTDAQFIAFQLDNIYGEQVIPIYQPIGFYVSVPASCKYPENAVKYLDFLADYDTCLVLQNGFEGVHYEMIDGSPVLIEYTDAEKAAIEGYERITCGDLNLLYNGSPFNFKSSLINVSEAEQRYRPMFDQAVQLSVIGGIADYYYGGIVTDAEEMYAGFVPSLEKSIPQLIACETAQFDSTYDSLIQDYLSKGGQEIINDKIELYRQIEASKD